MYAKRVIVPVMATCLAMLLCLCGCGNTGLSDESASQVYADVQETGTPTASGTTTASENKELSKTTDTASAKDASSDDATEQSTTTGKETTTTKKTTTTEKATTTTEKPTTTTKKPTTTTKKETTTTKDPYETIVLNKKTTYYDFEGYFTLDRYNDQLEDLGIITNNKAAYASEYRDIETDKVVWFICDGDKVAYVDVANYVNEGPGRGEVYVRVKD